MSVLAEAKIVLFGDASDATKALKSLEDTLGEVGDTLKNWGTTVGVAVGAAGAAVTAAALVMDNAYSDIRKSTGATGDDLRGLQKSFDAVFSSVSDEAPTVALALSEVAKRTGLVGPELEAVTKQALDWAGVNKTEVGPSIRTLSQLMNGLELDINELPDIMDKMTYASQKTGIGALDLADGVINAGLAFVKMGFGVDQSIALFSQFEKVGAKPSDVVSTLNRTLTKLAQEGYTDAEAAFRGLLQQIKDTPNEMDAVVKAADAFGAQFGSKIAEEIRGGTFEIDAFVAELQNARGVTAQTAEESKTFTERWKELRNQLTLALAPIGKLILDMGQSLIPAIQSAAHWIQNLDDAQRKWVVAIGATLASLSAMAVVVGTVAKTLATMKILAVASSFVQWSSAVLGLARGVKTLNDALTLLKIAIGPVGWAIAGITTVAALLLWWKNKQDDTTVAITDADKALGGFQQSLDGVSNAQLRLIRTQMTAEMVALQTAITTGDFKLQSFGDAAGSAATAVNMLGRQNQTTAAATAEAQQRVDLLRQQLQSLDATIANNVRSEQLLANIRAEGNRVLANTKTDIEGQKKALEDLQKALQEIAEREKVIPLMHQALGTSYDTTKAKLSAYGTAIEALITAGYTMETQIPGLGKTLGSLVAEYKALEVSARNAEIGQKSLENAFGVAESAVKASITPLSQFNDTLYALQIAYDNNQITHAQFVEGQQRASLAVRGLGDALKTYDKILEDSQPPLIGFIRQHQELLLVMESGDKPLAGTQTALELLSRRYTEATRSIQDHLAPLQQLQARQEMLDAGFLMGIVTIGDYTAELDQMNHAVRVATIEFSESDEATKKYKIALADLDEQLRKGAISAEVHTQRTAELKREFRESKESADIFGQALSQVATEGMELFVQGANRAEDAIRNFVQDAIRQLARLAANEIFGTLLGGPIGGLAGGLLGKFFGGFFADGGYLQPGKFGIVGERGPELVQAGRQGMTITPALAVAGAGESSGGGVDFGGMAGAILDRLGPPPVLSPEAAATDQYYRRLFGALVDDGRRRGVL